MKQEQKPNLLIFGDYDAKYPRTWTLFEVCKKLGFHLIELNIEGRTGIQKYRYILRELRKIKKFNTVLVPFPGFVMFPIIRCFTRKPIIYDALISTYDTDVYDRRYYKKWSFGGLYAYFLDWFACTFANMVLTDTNASKEYFIKTFRCNSKKIFRMWTGTNRDNFKSEPRENVKKQRFIVGFQGKVVERITGLEYIVEAMKLLRAYPDIELWIIGPENKMITIKTLVHEWQLKNVIFKGWIQGEALKKAMSECDIFVSSFGDTEKLKRTIPLKVFDTLALKKPIIVGDTKGVRELLKNDVHAALVPLANAKAIADKILFLKENPKTAEKIAENGYDLYRKELNIKNIADTLIHDLKRRKEFIELCETLRS